MALLLSLSEVWILSSIKPFIESFSTINIKDLGDSDLNNYKIQLMVLMNFYLLLFYVEF